MVFCIPKKYGQTLSNPTKSSSIGLTAASAGDELMFAARWLQSSTVAPERRVMPDRWISVEEVAEYLGVSKDTIYGWIAKKEMPAHKELLSNVGDGRD
jgi:Helix-turn-helix domain